MSDAIVRITDNARAVLALSAELDALDRDIKLERDRHHQTMSAMLAKKEALADAIFKLAGGHSIAD